MKKKFIKKIQILTLLRYLQNQLPEVQVTAKYMVDRELVNDFYRAYAYFRWVDDIIDETPLSLEERTLFILCQKKLIDSLYKNEKTLEQLRTTTCIIKC